MNHLLIVDDDKDFRELLIKTLKNQGYRATGIAHVDQITSSVTLYRPDVILLDIMFDSEMLGIAECQRLRTWNTIPVIIISALNDEAIKVKALDAGADDYLTKPFGVNELLARIRAVERRIAQRPSMPSALLIISDLSVNFETRVVKLHDQQIHLTKKEFALLKTLADAQGRLVTYERILLTVWPEENHVERSKVRALVRQLRVKLGEDLIKPTYIATEAGVGYRLQMENQVSDLSTLSSTTPVMNELASE